MFTYNGDQLFQIQALVTAGNFPAAYRLAASFASGGIVHAYSFSRLGSGCDGEGRG